MFLMVSHTESMKLTFFELVERDTAAGVAARTDYSVQYIGQMYRGVKPVAAPAVRRLRDAYGAIFDREHHLQELGLLDPTPDLDATA